MAAVSKISQAFLAFLAHWDAGGLSKGNMYRELTSITSMVAITFVENLTSLKILVFYAIKQSFGQNYSKMVYVYLNYHPSLNSSNCQISVVTWVGTVQRAIRKS